MNLENLLPDLVKCFYFSDPIGGDIEYTEIPMKVNAENISGQLLEYYQHLSFESDCYFGDQFFGLVLFSIQSNGRELSSWGLEDMNGKMEGIQSLLKILQMMLSFVILAMRNALFTG